MDGGFGDDVCVQAVAQINRVDVVAGAKLACARWYSLGRIVRHAPWPAREYHSPFQVAVHDGEEDLEKQVDGIYQHRQQVQPRLTSHCGDVLCCVARVFGIKARASKLTVSPGRASAQMDRCA